MNSISRMKEILGDQVVPRKFMQTGSRVICDPPVMDTDEDWLILVDDLSVACNALQDDGWTRGQDYHIGSEIRFDTARKGEVNLILYDEEVGYERFATATRISKLLNLTNKVDRVAVHVAATELEPTGLEDF